VWRASIFDVLILNADRHGANWGAVPGHGRQRLKVVDHGYAFWRRDLNSAFVNLKLGDALPDELLEDVSGFISRCWQTQLAELLDANELEDLVSRGEHLVATGRLNLA
jgi:hypothetical protein